LEKILLGGNGRVANYFTPTDSVKGTMNEGLKNNHNNLKKKTQTQINRYPDSEILELIQSIEIYP